MSKLKYWFWLLPGLMVGFTLGVAIGAFIQSKADAQIAQLAADRKSAELERMADRFDEVLAGLKRTTMLASWYGIPFHGRLRADGKRFDMHKNTVAHRTLPLGTIILMENVENGKLSLGIVRDRGPYISPRALDVSYAIAQELGMVSKGLAVIRITILRGE
jgi:rare lipoprotein A (peptidoglycan hydrolase)